MSDWYYAENNEQKGPINESELKANLASNKLPAETLVWKDGMDNWTPANQVSAFSFRQAPAPAAVQPSAPAAAKPAATPAGSAADPDSTKPVDLKSIVGAPEPLQVTAEDADANKVFGILAYLWILCLVPLIAAKDSPYAKYHANQGLVLFILWIAMVILVQIVVSVFHMLGLYALDWIFALLYLIPFGLLIYGIINALAGKCVPLPVIGGIKLLK